MPSSVLNLVGHACDGEAMLKECNLTCNELRAEVKVLNKALVEEKEKLMDESNRTAAENMRFGAMNNA